MDLLSTENCTYFIQITVTSFLHEISTGLCFYFLHCSISCGRFFIRSAEYSFKIMNNHFWPMLEQFKSTLKWHGIEWKATILRQCHCYQVNSYKWLATKLPPVHTAFDCCSIMWLVDWRESFDILSACHAKFMICLHCKLWF